MRSRFFCNAVVKIVTNLTPHQLLNIAQKIETKQGRVRKKTWGPRTLDIDIIYNGELKIKTKKLIVPHPYYQERDFVLDCSLKCAKDDSIDL